MRRVELAFFDAGGGHRNAALALHEVLERQEPPWNVSLLNLQELLDPLDIVRRLSGIRLQDAYNILLRHGWTLGSAHLLRVTQFIIRRYHSSAVRLLEDYWSRTRPDLVVSLVPNLNRALRESVCRALPSTPFATVLTDLADYPPHFWIEAERQFLICGTERAVEQARAMGHSTDDIFLTSGMILNPRFYEQPSVSRSVERTRLGMHAELPTGIVSFGSEGSKTILEIAQCLDRSGLELQLILVCGRNDGLASTARRQKWRIPVHIQGFTDAIPRLMHLSDFFIGKPGPGSISEAIHLKLPVIVVRNAWTLPQERYNAKWVREKGVGLVVPSHRQVASAVAELLKPGELARFRARAAELNNRAIFEIPAIFEKILHGEPEKAAVNPEMENVRS